MLKKFIIYLISALIFIPQPAYAMETMATSPAITKPANIMTKMSQVTASIDPNSKLKNFREQIQTIKDARKKTIVEKINNRITSSNTNLTTKMQNALDRMSNVLQQIATKEATLATSGANTTTLKTALANAKIAVTAAQTAVDAQKAKTYTGVITDDTTLGAVISALVRQFNQDIQATHKQVINAKMAVVASMQELVKLNTPAATATPAL